VTLIWATRGRTWGHRFLLDGGHTDPLPIYDEVFSHVADKRELCAEVGGRVALRLADPQGRKDLAGRIIVHEFVVFLPLATKVTTIDEGLQHIWNRPDIGDRYSEIWNVPDPGAAATQ
jgi:hypothetical protein